MNLFERLEEQRREAYVRAVLRAPGTDDVVGVIGSCWRRVRAVCVIVSIFQGEWSVMRKCNRSLLAVLFVLCLVASAQAFWGPNIDAVDQAYVKEKVGQPGFVLVDVRTEDIYNGKSPREGIPSGHIAGAVNFPLANLKAEGAVEALEKVGIVKDAEIIVYCNRGNQSSQFAEALVRDFGFDAKKVKNYKGSVIDWSKNPANKLEPEGHE